MAFEGTLKDFSLAEIFQLISYQKKTGILTLKGEGKKATVTFMEGNVISAETIDEKLEDRLGQRLVRCNLITKEQLLKALNIQKETLQRLGYILVSKKFISQLDMERNLRDIICEKIYKLFRWREGEYHFTIREGDDFSDKYFKPISTQSVLMEAVQMIDEWPLIEKKIPSFDIIFDKIKDDSLQVVLEKDEMDELALPEQFFEEKEEISSESEFKENAKAIKLSSNEYKVFNAIDGQRSVTDIIDYCNMGDFDAARALYDLLDRKLIFYKEEKRPVIIAKEEKKIPASFSIISYLILLCLVGFSIFTIIRPKNQISRPARFINDNMINPDKPTVDYLKIKKIALAIDSYYLIHSTYPADLESLTKEGFLKAKEIENSRGIKFTYQFLQDRYIISSSPVKGSPATLSYQKLIPIK
jgi:hypothetical protein